MKVQTIQHRIKRFTPRFIAICGALLMGVASSHAIAQSPLLNFLSTSSGGQAGYANSGVRQLSHQGQSYRVIDAGSVETAGDLRREAPMGSSIVGDLPVEQGSVQHTGLLSRTGGSCSSGACGGACGGSCGPYSAYSMDGYGGAMACGIPCEPYCYGVLEWLYMERTGSDSLSYSPQYRVPEFDFEHAPRLTIGSLPDCVHGFEVTWTGIFEWDRSIVFNDPTGSLTSFFVPRGFPNPVDMTGFENGLVQTQRWEAEYWSLEANKTLVGWDVAKLLVGARYIDYDENYFFTSRSTPALNQFGFMNSDVQNQMIGIQAGMDLLYPVGRFAYVDFRTRAGVFLNFAESLVQINSNGRNVVANFDEDEDLAGVFEVGSGYRYQLGEILAIRAGGEILYITGIATAPDQVSSVITPRTGRSTQANEDIFVYGVSLGAELRF